MSQLKNDLLLRTLRGEETERTPVWMMRQAGRYLPDYMKLKEKYSFFERCQTPELATEITIQPVEQVGVDAAIIFSDILVVPQAMGLEVQMVEGKGPFLPDPVKQEKDLQRLHLPDVDETLGYVFDALRLTKKTLDGRVPLIGFAGAPWTLLCYMVQGKGSKTFDEAKAFCYTQPGTAHRLLQMITDTTIAYLKGQAKAGADVVQIFDSWGGLLGPDDFENLSLRYIRQIVAALKDVIPTIIFAKGAFSSLEGMAATGAQGLGIDWCIRPAMARQLAGANVTLQGNFDPAKLMSPIPVIEQEVKTMMAAFSGTRHIANLGHGILPEIPVDHARAFVQAVKNYRTF
ncbi:uroporphyrinogen decarboxylase [Flavitalea sp. BT771]|uniref:uroporphyrinogen decarboxylase n=1 Tax=Flavitalea sp. BT771 TaxID=3063329 RepID=UPI0026E3C3A8|nr:uroporphyrinogen decarboxylase [Flavitalea sp. BT771]MDO6433802.1 uroporphyrinogen decarboxylase [Flavitalea sp. BT771]MDV6222293.1 uroporphyrinogen decarboxylase [Flavitalea sp. BT771]